MSDSRPVLVAKNIIASMGSIVRVANGYSHDLLPEQILDLKKDLETDGTGAHRVTLYSSTFDNQQQGDEAAYSQTLKTVHFHVDGAVQVQEDYEFEVGNAMADIERIVMKDISQGGFCINTFLRSGEKYALKPNGFGLYTISFDCLIRHAVNDPSLEYQVTYN